jgi:DNA modification methylase
VKISITDLSLDPKNARKHSARNLEAIAASLEKFGQRKPIVVHRGVVLAGNGTLEAARSLGWTEIDVAEVPDDWDNDTAKAYALADNRSAELAEWDESELAKQLLELQDADWDITELGFDIPALADIEPSDEDEIPEPPVEPKTKLGDIYQLGRHRLMCGDSTDLTSVERLMNGKRANICFTSPPYNAGSLEIKGNKTTGKKYNSFDDNQSESKYGHFIKSNLNCIFAVCDEVLYNIGLVEGNKRVIVDILAEYRNKFKDIIYWKKSVVAPHIQPGIINNLVEFILCFGDGKRKFQYAQFKQGSYWNVIEGANASSNEFANIHKATFPVYLPENIIANFCPPNGLVLDTFGGTGTTLIAADKLNRTSYIMELDPKYCDVIVTRWENFTGLKAELVNGSN